MLRIKKVPIDVPLPAGEVGMVIMQPFVELDTSRVPYKWKTDQKNAQINKILKTLDIAKNVNNGCDKIHFTLFPEYSIPGLDGIRKINDVLSAEEWKKGTIVMGGIDGLTKAEYVDLLNQDNISAVKENLPLCIPDNNWVNCCIIWVKQTDGHVMKYVQPKICASWPERNITQQGMFPGKSVYIFSGQFEDQTNYHFISLLCFDWIGPVDNHFGVDAVLSRINTYWNNNRKEMHLLFVIQSNDKPNHYKFLENARNYFELRTTYRFVNRDECLILFANTAGRETPGKCSDYGFTSLISSVNTRYDNNSCPPTVAVNKNNLRNTDILGRCKDTLFRENGACNHSFKVRLPAFISGGPEGRCLPIEEAYVYAIDDETSDPRIPNGPVPASIKWINDEMDFIDHLLINHPTHPLKAQIETVFHNISYALRRSSDDYIRQSIEWATVGYDKRIKLTEKIWVHDVDNWNDEEKKSLAVLVHLLTILSLCKAVSITGAPAHATMQIGDDIIDIFVVSGCKTHQEGLLHATKFVSGASRYALVITDAEHDFMLPTERERDIFEARPEISGDRGPRFGEPSSRLIHCGYQNVKEVCSSHDLSALAAKVDELIGL